MDYTRKEMSVSMLRVWRRKGWSANIKKSGGSTCHVSCCVSLHVLVWKVLLYLSVLVCEIFRYLDGFVTIICTRFSVGLGICLCSVYRTFGTHQLMFMCELLCVTDLTTVY